MITCTLLDFSETLFWSHSSRSTVEAQAELNLLHGSDFLRAITAEQSDPVGPAHCAVTIAATMRTGLAIALAHIYADDK